MSAIFTGWQACEARTARQYAHADAIEAKKESKRAADDAKQEAKGISDRQQLDIKEARDSARKSAEAAQKLAMGMERSAKAAEVSANAGRDALSVSRQALQINEAPLLTVLTSRLQAELAVDKPVSIDLKILNAGKGPATNLGSRLWIRVIPATQSLDFTNAPAEDPEHFPTLSANTTFTPSLVLHPNFDLPLTQLAYDGIKNGSLTLYVFGEITYGETIDLKRSYQLKFCSMYNRASRSPLDLVICPVHNETVIK